MTTRKPALTLTDAPHADDAPTVGTPSPADDAATLRAWIVTACQRARGPGLAAALRAIVLATLSPRPQNVLLLGPPGTGKTMLAGLWERASGARALVRTLSSWTEDTALLGAVDVAALASSGRIVRVTGATTPGAPPTLADADFVLLDELPRAARGVKDLALSSLSDRRTPDGVPVPAHAIVAGANTRLTSEDDRALSDRFALRVEVPRLTDPDDLMSVLWGSHRVDGHDPTRVEVPTLRPGLVEGLRAEAARVTVPHDVASAFVTLAVTLRGAPPSGASYPDVSDRRLELAAHLMSAHAVLCGRSAIDWSDLPAVLPLSLDDGAESRAAVRAAIDACVPRYVRALTDLEAAIVEAVARARRVGGVVDARPGDGDAHTRVADTLDALISPLRSYGDDVAARGEALVDDAHDRIATAHAEGAAAYAAHRAASRKARA